MSMHTYRAIPWLSLRQPYTRKSKDSSSEHTFSPGSIIIIHQWAGGSSPPAKAPAKTTIMSNHKPLQESLPARPRGEARGEPNREKRNTSQQGGTINSARMTTAWPSGNNSAVTVASQQRSSSARRGEGSVTFDVQVVSVRPVSSIGIYMLTRQTTRMRSRMYGSAYTTFSPPRTGQRTS